MLEIVFIITVLFHGKLDLNVYRRQHVINIYNISAILLYVILKSVNNTLLFLLVISSPRCHLSIACARVNAGGIYFKLRDFK